MLKEQLQTVVRDNHILKRAVSIQHERQSEHENCTQEISQLKQLISQYQEQVRTLEVISTDFQFSTTGSPLMFFFNLMQHFNEPKQCMSNFMWLCMFGLSHFMVLLGLMIILC